MLTGTSEAVLRQFLRYTVVGTLSFAIDLLVLALATDLFGVHYLVSGVFGFAAGVTVNYFLSVGWVFEGRTLRSRKLEFLLFGLVGLTGLALNEGMLYLLAGKFGFHYAVAKTAAALAVLVWTFFARRALLFSSKDTQRKPPQTSSDGS